MDKTAILVDGGFYRKRARYLWGEMEEEEDQLEPPATRVLNWLLKTGWLRKVDDYSTMTVNLPGAGAYIIRYARKMLTLTNPIPRHGPPLSLTNLSRCGNLLSV